MKAVRFTLKAVLFGLATLGFLALFCESDNGLAQFGVTAGGLLVLALSCKGLDKLGVFEGEEEV